MIRLTGKVKADYMKNIKKYFLCLCLSLGISYYLFSYVTIEFLYYFYQGSPKLEEMIFLSVFVGQTLMMYSFMMCIWDRKLSINPWQSKGLWFLYFGVMVLLLFGRSTIGKNVNWNLGELCQFNREHIFHHLLNFILFIPAGYWLRKKSVGTAIGITIGIVLGIESLQLLLQRGIFDVVDILLDTLGMLSGYALSKYFFIRHENPLKNRYLF